MKIDWKKKLTSRKFWLAIVALVMTIMVFLKADEGSQLQVKSLIMAGAEVIAYIIGEGLADSGAGK